ncbi:hypothetical protein [Melghirimyces profundicolus]|uniref:hypothetical protein n=1 Tax=Melghirimyces profundicolus TaxID=1242148 RepID=UPI000D3C27E4|nr:hypothetical protein [Melghirimyces profundicolus]
MKNGGTAEERGSHPRITIGKTGNVKKVPYVKTAFNPIGKGRGRFFLKKIQNKCSYSGGNQGDEEVSADV